MKPALSYLCLRASKAAAITWFGRSISNPWLTSMAFNPGLVQSDMGNSAAVRLGLERAPVTLRKVLVV